MNNFDTDFYISNFKSIDKSDFVMLTQFNFIRVYNALTASSDGDSVYEYERPSYDTITGKNPLI